MALFDIAVGKRKDTSADKQVHYIGCLMHKTRKTKYFHFADTIDGIDFYISGHIHKPSDEPQAKVYVDTHNKKASIKPCEVITVASMLNYGGYALEGAFRVQSQKLYSLILNGETKQMQTKGFYL